MSTNEQTERIERKCCTTPYPNRMYPTAEENARYRLGLYDARFCIDRRSTTKWPVGWSKGNAAYFDGLMDGARSEGHGHGA